ncbi:MAG TPA: beta-N-acetylhexosaminidase [Micromonosporaceae bacterium]|nr:beta-N-acetylhexosaminidase [Micromonosporaceae bacterium]
MIPLPSQVIPDAGTLRLTGQPFVGPQPIGDLLAELGLPVAGIWSVTSLHGEEGYRIRAGADGLTVDGGETGLKWAVQTLRQLLGDGGELSYVDITDAPRYAWRGSLLDVARWHLPIEFLHRYVDLMALHKLNRLHLHLTDDQGWRFEVRRYPRLTEVGAFRKESMKGHFFDEKFDGRPHGGFYTQEQLRGLVAYAKRRGVEIMPEIDLPGHTQAAIAAYPSLGSEPTEVSTRWGIHDIVLNTAPETVDFFKHVLDEVIEVFPFEHVHLGGDEVRSMEDHVVGWWIGQLQQHLGDRGRKVAVWDELLDSDPPKDLLFFGWRDVTKAPAAREAGFEAVSCPQEHAYFDWAESDRDDEPLAIAGYIPLEQAYAFEPGDVTGVQGNLWTEYLPTPELVEWRAYPRLAALAEVGWGKADFPDFSERLPSHLELLRKLGVNFRPI